MSYPDPTKPEEFVAWENAQKLPREVSWLRSLASFPTAVPNGEPTDQLLQELAQAAITGKYIYSDGKFSKLDGVEASINEAKKLRDQKIEADYNALIERRQAEERLDRYSPGLKKARALIAEPTVIVAKLGNVWDDDDPRVRSCAALDQILNELAPGITIVITVQVASLNLPEA